MVTQKVTRVPSRALDDFTRKVLEKGGLSREHAAIVADNLGQANLRGVDTHGVGLLSNYYRRLVSGGINPEPNVRVVKESPAALLVDGDAGPGQVATHFAMRKAIEKARASGVGWAQVMNSNHHGALAYFSLMAAEEDMIGITVTGAFPSMAPWGGKVRMLGNNPMAIAAPVEGERPLVLDMAMSVRAQGQLRLAEERGVPLDEGQALDADGVP
ncbi:MAG: Ldh family oxidoreductase, partial [Chloroflexota bacterium]|nr:Ldh family oxidoreductase [Chloroflexota bacterium]